MNFLNIEFKARCSDFGSVRAVLEQHGCEFMGVDHQVDTYFNVPRGRLKLREGSIENNLIYYEREDRAGSKRSGGLLFENAPGSTLKDVLIRSLGVKVVVDKRREIYFVDGNVKVHLDEVKGLGSFVEVEAIDYDGSIGEVRLQAQCDRYMTEFGVSRADLIAESYCDLIAAQSP
jgi:predicted adenylyl cyclase CyaB